MYYTKRFNEKPIDSAGKIQCSLVPKDVEIRDLADGLSHGTTFKPAYLTGTKNEDWKNQQLFALDFDGGTTIEAQKRRCHELHILPAFGYTSFSHTDEEHHFRLVFCSDKIITDGNQRNKIQMALIKMFDKTDSKCSDATRMFFGGKNLIPFDFENRIDTDKILNEYGSDIPEIKQPQHKKSKRTKAEPDATHLQKIEAITHLDVEAMRKLLEHHTDKEGNPYNSMDFQCGGTTVKCAADLHGFIKQIDLEEYLGIYDYVNCILPEHDDDSPSAHIYITDDGTPVYKCFGCEHVHTIVTITEKLANCSRSKAIDFISSVYGIKLEESDWAKQWKNTLIECAKYLDSDDFILVYPQLSKLIRTRKKHIQSMLLHFTDYVNEDLQVDGKPIFFASYDKLMKICGISSDKNSMSKTLTLFALLNMIIKLPLDDKIPKETLDKAISIAAKYGHKKITGFYSFCEYGTILFEGSEIIAQTLKENHMTLKGLSREYVMRTFGVELANVVFPQYVFENENYGTSKKSDDSTKQIENKILSLIKKQGYSLEKEIYGKNKKCEIQYKKSIQQILDELNLVKVKASKANKIKYNIPDSIPYQSYVVVVEK